MLMGSGWNRPWVDLLMESFFPPLILITDLLVAGNKNVLLVSVERVKAGFVTLLSLLTFFSIFLQILVVSFGYMDSIFNRRTVNFSL